MEKICIKNPALRFASVVACILVSSKQNKRKSAWNLFLHLSSSEQVESVFSHVWSGLKVFFLLIVKLCCCGRRSDRSAVFARVLVMLRKRSSLCVSTALGILLQLHFDKGQLTNRNLFCCKLLIVQNVDIVYQTAIRPYPNEEELLIFQTAGNNIINRMNNGIGSNNHLRSIDLFRSKII